jgi:hypothetical protein
MLAAVMLAAVASAHCDASHYFTTWSITKAPPAALPSGLASSYPNGAEVHYVFTMSASGTITAVADDASSPFVDLSSRWFYDSTFAPPLDSRCRGISTREYDWAVHFFPPGSGIVGYPQVVDGVDFGDMEYSGPGSCHDVSLTRGTYNSDGGEYFASIDDVFAGNVGGRTAAVVVLRCDYANQGYDEEAQLFTIEHGRATRVGVLGGAASWQDPLLPEYTPGWIYVDFEGGRLYADVWDRRNDCDPQSDWVMTAYTIRGGRSVKLDVEHHHRPGVPLACQECVLNPPAEQPSVCHP